MVLKMSVPVDASKVMVVLKQEDALPENAETVLKIERSKFRTAEMALNYGALNPFLNFLQLFATQSHTIHTSITAMQCCKQGQAMKLFEKVKIKLII